MLILNLKENKYGCVCCGYKALPTNSMGEICPICFWEEGYDDPKDLFGVSNANLITLYQAQENFRKFNCYKQEFFSKCRKPFKNEVKDGSWLPIQEKIEKGYDVTSSFNQIEKLAELLKQPDADVTFTNFKTLREIEMTGSYDNFGESVSLVNNQLFLHSLSINLSKKNLEGLTQLFKDYYKKGIFYYISWSIMLFSLANCTQLKLNQRITDIFVDIENNDYYGLGSMKATLREFWHKEVK